MTTIIYPRARREVDSGVKNSRLATTAVNGLLGTASMNRSTSPEVPTIDADEYRQFSDYLRSMCGIDLGINKQYLVATRVRRILRDYGLDGLAALTAALRQNAKPQLRQQVIDAMTTNETFWFRDGYPFQFLANTVLPELSKSRVGGKIKVWSAACSSGQEPYSISMVFEEALRSRVGRQICDGDILGTDVSSAILDSARAGCYDRISLARGLSEERRNNFFIPAADGAWQLKQSLRDRVRLRSFNLQDPYVLLGKFDVVFCRNVLIYFSSELKLQILKKIHSTLLPGGYLFLGSSEGIAGLSDYFEMVNCNPGVAYRAKVVPNQR